MCQGYESDGSARGPKIGDERTAEVRVYLASNDDSIPT